MRPRGSVNPITVLVFAGAAAALYWVIMFVPIYIDNMSMREAVDVGLTTGHLKAITDEQIVTQVLNRINNGQDAIGSHFEEDESGEQVEKRGMGLTADNVTIVRDDVARTLRISIDYTRDVRLKPTQKVHTSSFHIEKEGPLSQ